jgi:hypothetical protein
MSRGRAPFPHRSASARAVSSALAAAFGLGACAQAGVPGAPVFAQRVIITTYAEWPSAAEVALRVTDITRVPVRDALEDAPRRYRLTLQCPDEAACATAIRRLAEARSLVQAIERDTRQRIPGKPDRESSR